MSAPETANGKPQDSIHMENAVPLQQKPVEGAVDVEDPACPRNWPSWKKNAQILMVAFHSLSATFIAAGIIPAYETLAEEYGITVPEASYLTSVQVRIRGLVMATANNRVS